MIVLLFLAKVLLELRTGRREARGTTPQHNHEQKPSQAQKWQGKEKKPSSSLCCSWSVPSQVLFWWCEGHALPFSSGQEAWRNVLDTTTPVPQLERENGLSVSKLSHIKYSLFRDFFIHRLAWSTKGSTHTSFTTSSLTTATANKRCTVLHWHLQRGTPF